MNDNPHSGKDEGTAPQTAYRVLARKYRPQKFEDLIGQDAMVRTLANAFETGRIAQAYMLTGVRGVGKTTTARLIARALNYTGADKPTIDLPDYGEHCQAILESHHVDVIEMDAASKTGIDDVREIIESVRYRPITARYKVYIIDEVHMLSKQAFNALLKTLEEPPEHVKFVFATTEIRKVPVTVLSRCQRFDLRRLDVAALGEHFTSICEREKVTADAEALAMIARAAEGSVRDGLSLLDQAIAYGGDHVKADDVNAMLGLVDQARIIDLFEAVMKGDAAAALKQIEAQYAAGADPHTLITDLAQFVHWVTRLKIVPDDDGRSGRTETERKRGAALAGKLAMPHLTVAWQLLLKGLQEVAVSANPLMAAEMIIIRLAYAATLPSPADLVERLQNAPDQVTAGNGAHAQPAGASPSAPAQADARTAQPQMRTTSPVMPEAAATDAPASTTQAPRLASFADIVALAGERRDIKLKSQLEHLVRPVSVAPGKVEVALEPNAPPGLPGELGRKLEAWTGSRWIVLVSKSEGEKPIAVQKRERRAGLFDEARRNPKVRAVLDAFPGAEIVNLERPETPETVPGEDDSND
jgi:DNA polymerase-3 subunit gamma/tau